MLHVLNGMLRRGAVALAVGVSACSEPGISANETASSWSPDTLVLQPALLRGPTDATAPNALLGSPAQVRAGGGLLFLTGATVDRVAVLDSLANVVRWIGRRGRGPGELLGAAHLAVRDDHVFVAEALNERVSEFTFGGHFVRAYPAPFAAGALGLTPRLAVSASRSPTHYALLLNALGEGSNALRRVSAGKLHEQGRWNALPGHDLLAADSARLWVFDQGTAEVCSYDAPGAEAQCRALAPELVARLRKYRDHRVAELEAEMHVNVKAAPLVKDMVRAGCWLALLLPLTDMPIVLVDINDGTLTPVVSRSGAIPPWAHTATSFDWDGRGFVLVGDAGIGRLYVSRPPTRAFIH